METENKKDTKQQSSGIAKAVMIITLVAFAAGFGLCYYIFEYKKDEKPDYKSNLREVISYIEDLEKENSDMKKELEAPIGPLAPQETQPAAKPAETPAQNNVSAMQRELSDLRTAIDQSQALIRQNTELRAQLQALQSQLNTTRPAAAQAQPVPPAISAGQEAPSKP